ncbi:hypothetical protein [Demequina sp.]|uniref:hypothetical protein n=1 Tax=Demequina sp. TaxID=2050685 RepID=UPI003A8621B9
MTDIAWNLEALRDDARAWRCVSSSLAQAASLLEAVNLTNKDFMSFLSSSARAQTEVTRAVTALQDFATDGGVKTKQGSDVLLEVAEAYRANEDEARRALDGMWEPEDR